MANLYFPLSSSFEGVALGTIDKTEAFSASMFTTAIVAICSCVAYATGE
jgi:hypothetical protein